VSPPTLCAHGKIVMPGTTKLWAPPEIAPGSDITTAYGNYKVGSDSTVTVDSRVVTTLLNAGYNMSAMTPYPIVTGVTEVAIDGTHSTYYVTSGGTGGHEPLRLNFPFLDIGGFVNAQLIGLRTTIVLVNQPNGSDVVDLTVGLGGNLKSYIENNVPLGVEREISDIQLDYVGAFVCLMWAGDHWAIDMGLSRNQSTYTPINLAGDWSQILVQNLPTADPGVLGQLWSNLGILSISAG